MYCFLEVFYLRKIHLFGIGFALTVLLFMGTTGMAKSMVQDGQEVATLVQREEAAQVEKVVKEVPVDIWNLGVGSRGREVTQLQQLLSQVGCYAGSVDGVYGGQTERAVKKAQASLSVDITGRSDRMLMEGIRRMTEASPSRSGAGFRATRVLTMEATAYTPYDAGVIGITANGNAMRRGLVAVDTRVIPFGTRLYIEGYGYAIADDTGGAIRGNKIDLAMDTLEEAFQFGRRSVTVHILE